jgi:glycine dehydrogenase subunit 1
VVAELPTFLVSLVPTRDGGGFGFGVSTMERTSYDKREHATDYYGTTQWLWGITAGVYLALMGPQGMAELGAGIMQRSQFAAARLGRIRGVTAPRLAGPFFKEFVVDFSTSGKTVEQVNAHLLRNGIFGGIPLRSAFPALGESALYCVTEIHTAADIERLALAIEEAIR